MLDHMGRDEDTPSVHNIAPFVAPVIEEDKNLKVDSITKAAKEVNKITAEWEKAHAVLVAAETAFRKLNEELLEAKAHFRELTHLEG